MFISSKNNSNAINISNILTLFLLRHWTILEQFKKKSEGVQNKEGKNNSRKYTGSFIMSEE